MITNNTITIIGIGRGIMEILTVKMFDRVGDSSDIVALDLKDVNYVEVMRVNGNSSKVLVYNTPKGSHLAIHTLRDALLAYRSQQFELYDQSTIVNTKQIQNISPHPNGSIITFFDNSHTKVRKKFKNH
jgi:DNA-binding LytR/AlgR family response regulator